MFYLYDPINNVKTPTTYKLLEGITGYSQASLASKKCRYQKLSNINSYLIDDNISKEKLYELMLKEKPKNEIWKIVLNTRNHYEISNYGRIKRIYGNGRIKLLRPYIKHNKWLVIKIDGKEVQIHKLVTDAFLEQPKGTVIYHKNNRFNNHADNLGFKTRSELGKKFGVNGVPVIKIDRVTGEILDSYDNMAEAGRDNYLSKETIRQAVAGELKTAGGFIWKIDKEFLKG